MDKSKNKKSNIFDSDDESDCSDNEQDYEVNSKISENEENVSEEVNDNMLSSTIDSLGNINASDEQLEEEDEVFINPITGLPMTAEEATMELDPLTGMPIYEDDDDEREYINSIMKEKLTSDYYERIFERNSVESKKKVKRVRESKNKGVSMGDYLKEASEREESNRLENLRRNTEGLFRSQRAQARREELGLTSSRIKEKEYRYKLNSKFPPPTDKTFSKKYYSEEILSGSKPEFNDSSFPSL